MSPLKISLLVISLFATLTIYGQNKIDSIKRVVAESADTVRANALMDLAMELIYTNPQESEKLASEAALMSRKIDYPRGIAKAFQIASISHDIRGNYSKAVESAQAGIDAIQEYNLMHEKELNAALLNVQGLALYHQSRYNEALTSFFAALKIINTTKNITRLAHLYSNIGLVYHDLHDLEKALEYYTQSLQYALKNNNSISVGRATNNIGLIYDQKAEYDSALKYYQWSLEYKLKSGDENGLSGTYLNLGVTYKKLLDYDNAIRYFDRSEIIKLKIDDRLGILNVQDGKADIYIRQKKYKQADDILKSSLKLLDSLESSEPRTVVFHRLYDLYQSQGKYKEALEWYVKKTNLKDSLFTAEKNKQALEIETLYETEKKEQVIKLLEKDKQIQSIWRYLLMGSVLIIGIIYFLQRSRTKKAKQFLQIQQELNGQLKENDLLKSRFFANISHEFRTPLSLIIAPVEEKINSAQQSVSDQTTFQLIKRNAYRLLDLVNQLLDLSKLEFGKMRLHIQHDNIRDFLVTLTASFESLAESRKINFSTKIDINSSVVWFDKDKLEKIVNNLLFNAFKHTPVQGFINLEFTIPERSMTLLIKVTDTGSGISKEDLPHIFSPFYQSKHSNFEGLGSGLGLSIVHELLKLHNGKIEINSIENQGTTIVVTLPVDKEKLPDAIVVNQKDFTLSPGLQTEVIDYLDKEIEEIYEESILVVEDNSDLRHFISSIFQNQYRVYAAENGEQGLHLALDKTPDVIISDVMMPKLNGVELVSQIKSDERTSHIPMILLTAKSDLESKLEGLEVGADDYISKPFSVEELKIRVTNLIEQRKKLISKFGSNISERSKEPTEPSLEEKFVQKAKLIVEKYLSDSNFGVEQMAFEMNLSRTQLFRKLKAVIGLSPNELINDVRLQRAADLIRAKSDTLSQISYLVGFNDPSYFAKRFRKKFGKSPSEYGLN
jgi:signal transduction histidine kinase/DNA-binding response OmpR family regulator/Tfp pilus assembly protein PilF